jgi:hypothetical protein
LKKEATKTLIKSAKRAEKYLRENPTPETLSIVTDLQAAIHYAKEAEKKNKGVPQ